MAQEKTKFLVTLWNVILAKAGIQLLYWISASAKQPPLNGVAGMTVKHMIKQLFVLFLLIFSACSKTPAIDVTFDQLCTAEMSDKRVATNGYLELGSSVFCSNSSGQYRCGLNFVPTPGGSPVVDADVIEGNGSNEMEKYKSGSVLKFRSNTGEVLGSQHQIKLSGKVHSFEDPVSKAKGCYIYVDQIDKL